MMFQQNFCRLCEKGQTKCSLLENQVTEMLESLTSIKIAHDEKTSTFICLECFNDVKVAFTIQQRLVVRETRHRNELLADFLIENHEELLSVIQKDLEEESNAKDEELRASVPSEMLPTKFKCKQCPAVFQFSSNFLEHLQVHIVSITEEDTVLCEHCGCFFSSGQEYNTHTTVSNAHMSSTFEKNFDKSTKVEKQTPNMKDFVCDVCNEAFSLQYSLQVHKNQHKVSTAYPYICDICNHRFRMVASLRAHQKIAHKIKLTSDNIVNKIPEEKTG